MTLYTWLIKLYPEAHRAEYGALMEQAFHDLQRDTPNGFALWWRILRDVIASAPREHLAAWRADLGFLKRLGQPRQPFPARAIALSVIPGVLYIPVQASWQLGVQDTRPLLWLFMGVCALLCVAGLVVNRGKLPVWTFVGLGMLLTMLPLRIAAYLLLWFAPLRPYDPLVFIVAGLIALIASMIASARLAREHRELSGLVLLGTLGLALSYMEPEYGLGLWISQPGLVILLGYAHFAFYLILAPILMLRARSAEGRLRGLLLPVIAGIAFAAAVPLAKVPYYIASPVSNVSWGGAITALLFRLWGGGQMLLLYLAAMASIAMRRARWMRHNRA